MRQRREVQSRPHVARRGLVRHLEERRVALLMGPEVIFEFVQIQIGGLLTPPEQVVEDLFEQWAQRADRALDAQLAVDLVLQGEVHFAERRRVVVQLLNRVEVLFEHVDVVLGVVAGVRPGLYRMKSKMLVSFEGSNWPVFGQKKSFINFDHRSKKNSLFSELQNFDLWLVLCSHSPPPGCK